MLNVDLFNALKRQTGADRERFAVWRTPTDILTGRFVRFSVHYDF